MNRQNRKRLGIGRWANRGDRPDYSFDEAIFFLALHLYGMVEESRGDKDTGR